MSWRINNKYRPFITNNDEDLRKAQCYRMTQNNNRMAELIRALLTGGADPENNHREADGELRRMIAQQNNPELKWSTKIDGNDRRPDQTRVSARKKNIGQLTTMDYTPADLVKLCFTNSQLDILEDNTNKDARKQKEDLFDKWKDSRRDVNLLSTIYRESDFVYELHKMKD